MFSKLAIRNVRRQLGSYLIYFMTVSMTVALLFAVNNIIMGDEIIRYSSAIPELKPGLLGIILFISLIVAFVLSYATSFMLRLRKREFGTYLTLGMTRKNILLLFISETMLICLAALAAGILLGLLIYQGLMAITLRLLEMDFAIAAYSLKGTVFTVVLVLGIFILSSLTSALYLRRVSIYDLICGGKKPQKTVRHPGIWFAVTVVSLELIISSCFSFVEEWEYAIKNGTDAYGIFPPLFTFAVCIILFHTGFSRSAVYILLRRKTMCCRGTNTFILRQLSQTLGSNSVMIGFLAFLLTFGVIGANLSFETKSTQEIYLNQMYPYDVMYRENNFYDGVTTQERPSREEAEQILEQYTAIREKIPYTIYDSGQSDLYRYTKWYGEGYGGLTDSFMSESDFNALVVPLGYEPLELENEFVIVANVTGGIGEDWEGAQFTRDGVTYRFREIALAAYPEFSYVYFYAVVPDEAVKTMTPSMSYVAYDLQDGKYDMDKLEAALNYTVTEEYMGGQVVMKCNDFSFREEGREELNGQNAILVIGALFVSGVFLLMVLAILALKTLSGLSEDRRRYQILFLLGAGEREQSRALFRQTFSFFLTPFVVSLFMGFPSAVIFKKIYRMNGMSADLSYFYVIAAAIALIMAVVYLLYYTAAYLIAKRAVVRCDM